MSEGVQVDEIASVEGITIFGQPEYKWELRLSKDSNFVIQLFVAPNKFHRFMQKLMLGFEWTEMLFCNLNSSGVILVGSYPFQISDFMNGVIQQIFYINMCIFVVDISNQRPTCFRFPPFPPVR